MNTNHANDAIPDNAKNISNVTDAASGVMSFRTPVRGHAFASAMPGAEPLRPGRPIRLVREPGNPADPFAVAVWVAEERGPWRVGYLDRAVAARIAPRLDTGASVDGEVDGWIQEPEGRWWRPLVRVAATRSRSPRRPVARLSGRPPASWVQPVHEG